MMLPLSLEIILVVCSVAVYAVFSMMETSILTVRSSRMRKLANDVNERQKIRDRATAVLEIKSRPEEFLAFVQSATILAAILAATFMSFIAIDDLQSVTASVFHTDPTTSTAIAFIAAISTLASLLLTFGGLIPKSVALHANLRFSLLFGTLVRSAMRVTSFGTRLPVVIANLFLKPFKDSASFAESRISEEEFLVMLEEGKRTGVIDETENKLIENIFDFREKTVREVMVPRTKIVAIDIDSPREAVIPKIVDEGYTRLPVFQDTLDTILGVVYSKDVLALIEHPDLIILYDITRPVIFVPETKLIPELLRELQQRKMHLAIVVDEFGGTAGIVTLEDILEEIVGEIQDEYDEEQTVVIDEATASVTLLATLSVEDANEHIHKVLGGFRIPEADEYDSVGGYVTKHFGHIPETNESFETDTVRLTVLKRTEKEVLQVRIVKKPRAV